MIHKEEKEKSRYLKQFEDSGIRARSMFEGKEKFGSMRNRDLQNIRNSGINGCIGYDGTQSRDSQSGSGCV